ncbi:MAG: DUF342 domain-containing protein [Desulfobacter sp.]|nr:MAG: DUF342 domain-containing protein [Desulfobacter sp.]
MAENSERIPTLAELALKYGTISRDQYIHLTKLFALVKREKQTPDYGEMLIEQKMATSYQIGLLRLIRDYHIIRRHGEAFGKIAVKRGFATQIDIQRALDIQKEEFKKSRLKKLMGDILVESGVITATQQKQILKEQTLLDNKSREILAEETDRPDPEGVISLSDAEKNFLRVKGLDREFSAAVIEKGFASENDVMRARETQEEIFEENRAIKILGDIMVSMKMLTPDQKNLILEEQGRIEDIPEKERIPDLTITPAPDGMTAWIELNPKRMAAISLEQIKSELAAEGMTRGIYPDEMLNCWLVEKHPRFPVARLDYSKDLQDARNLESVFNLNLTEKGEKRKGDLLVRQDSTWNTGKRINIYNQETAAVSDLDFTISCGSGTRPSKDKASIVASKTGRPALSAERTLYIHPVINVLEDADLRYGPLEPYANLSITGTITGAYPVTAGDVWAGEIRGGVIEAVGEVRTKVGMTDAVIKAQGDVYARYLHNCRIETYGSVYVENEIFDSDIRCSGMVDSPDCRVISSRIYAKKGVRLSGAGSAKTAKCSIFAGSNHHIVSLGAAVLKEIHSISRVLEDLKEEQAGEKNASKKIFRKMVELKIFHDRARQKKESLVMEFKKNRSRLNKKQSRNILSLISSFEKRMETSIGALKELNQNKKVHDKKTAGLEKKIKVQSRKTAAEIMTLERRLFAALERARSDSFSTEIKISGEAWQGTVLGGIYSLKTLEENLESFQAEEIGSGDPSSAARIKITRTS